MRNQQSRQKAAQHVDNSQHSETERSAWNGELNGERLCLLDKQFTGTLVEGESARLALLQAQFKEYMDSKPLDTSKAEAALRLLRSLS